MKMDLALNDLQRLICHENQTTKNEKLNNAIETLSEKNEQKLDTRSLKSHLII